MEHEDNHAHGIGYLFGVCSIAAVLILWMTLLSWGIGHLFGQDWTFVNVAFAHLLGFGALGTFGAFAFWR